MPRLPLIFCALILLNPTLRATPADDFRAQGKELLANKEKKSDDEVLKNGALPMSVLETHLKEWVAKRESA